MNTYETIPVDVANVTDNTTFCYTCLTNEYSISTLNYNNKTGISSSVKTDASWVSQVKFTEANGYGSFLSTNSVFVQFPTKMSSFTPPPYLVPLNLIVLYDVSSSNEQPKTLFSFLKRFTSMQFLYFLPFNHSPQNILHSGRCNQSSINHLMNSLCKIKYGGGTRYSDAFNKMKNDVLRQKEDLVSKVLDVVLISDGNEIQNRKLLWKVLDGIPEEYVTNVHTIDTGNGTWGDKLREISCKYGNSFYIDINEKTIEQLLTVFWLRANVAKSQLVQDGQLFSGKSDTTVVLMELLYTYPADKIFGKRSYGVIGVYSSEKTTDTDEFMSNPPTEVRTIQLQLYVLRSYLEMEMCGNEIKPTAEEVEDIKNSISSIDKWYSGPADLSSAICTNVSETKALKCGMVDGCQAFDANNYYLRETCGVKGVGLVVLMVLLLFV